MVTLSPATSETVTARWASTAESGAGEVFDDGVGEGDETLEVTIDLPTGPAMVPGGSATGTIMNQHPMPQARAARFRRTAGLPLPHQAGGHNPAAGRT